MFRGTKRNIFLRRIRYEEPYLNILSIEIPDTSPKLAMQQSPTSLSPPTPIKLKIKRNTGSGLTSTVTLSDQGQDGGSIEVQGQQGKGTGSRRASAGSTKR